MKTYLLLIKKALLLQTLDRFTAVSIRIPMIFLKEIYQTGAHIFPEPIHIMPICTCHFHLPLKILDFPTFPLGHAAGLLSPLEKHISLEYIYTFLSLPPFSISLHKTYLYLKKLIRNFWYLYGTISHK